MHEAPVDRLRRIRKREPVRLGRFIDPAERRVRVAARFGIEAVEGRVFLSRQEVDNGLRLVLIQQYPGQAHAPDMTKLTVAAHCDQLPERGCRILVAILVHVETRHRQLGLRRVGRIGIVRRQFGGDDLRLFEVAIADMNRQRFIQLRRLDLRIDLVALVLVVADEQSHRENDTCDDIAAVLSPPRAHLFNLFFF